MTEVANLGFASAVGDYQPRVKRSFCNNLLLVHEAASLLRMLLNQKKNSDIWYSDNGGALKKTKKNMIR